MSKADEAARQKVIVQIFCGDATGFVVEIDEHIPAEDNVETLSLIHI